MFLYEILVYTIHVKIQQFSYKKNKFKIPAPTWMDHMDHVPQQILKVILSICIIKKYETVTDNPSPKISVNKI